MQESDSRYQLAILAGPDEGRTVPLYEGRPLRIGRSEESDLTLNDQNVSRNHCLVQVNKGEVVILDSGSSGGTMVNGARVEEQRLRVGDTVQLGATVLRFQLAVSKDSDTVTGIVVQPAPTPVDPAPVPVARHSPPPEAPTPIVVQVGNQEPEELVQERVLDIREKRAARQEDREYYREDRKVNTAGIVGFALATTTLVLAVRPLFIEQEGWYGRTILGCMGMPLTIVALIYSLIGCAYTNRGRVLAFVGLGISVILIIFLLPHTLGTR